MAFGLRDAPDLPGISSKTKMWNSSYNHSLLSLTKVMVFSSKASRNYSNSIFKQGETGGKHL